MRPACSATLPVYRLQLARLPAPAPLRPPLHPPSPFPSPREPPKIMLSEISIKRDSVRAGIRLNLSSYSTRGRKETFRAGERLARDSKWPAFTVTLSFPLFSLFSPFLLYLRLSLIGDSFSAFPSSRLYSHIFLSDSCTFVLSPNWIGSPKPRRDFGLYRMRRSFPLLLSRSSSATKFAWSEGKRTRESNS